MVAGAEARKEKSEGARPPDPAPTDERKLRFGQTRKKQVTCYMQGTPVDERKMYHIPNYNAKRGLESRRPTLTTLIMSVPQFFNSVLLHAAPVHGVSKNSRDDQRRPPRPISVGKRKAGNFTS